MIKCDNLTNEDLCRIGSQIGEAFLAQPGSFSVLSAPSAAKLFTLVAKMGYETGHLYTTGQGQEGFCIYWTKAQRPGLWAQLKVGWGMVRCLRFRELMALKKSQNRWQPTEKRYKKAPDFVEVFLVAVRREYQGQGWLRRILEEPFALARERHTLCVLDTDCELKAGKYAYVGMTVADSREQGSGVTMYAMEYRPEAGEPKPGPGLSEQARRWNTFIETVCCRDPDTLNPIQKQAVLCFWYDTEMAGGGYCGYLDSYPHTDPGELTQALLAVGGQKAAAVFQKALDTGGADEWEQTDRAYEELTPALSDSLMAYVEAHKEAIFA